MKLRMMWSAVALSAMLVPTASVMATEVFDVWGTGYTFAEARENARNAGAQMCANAGYSNSWLEVVDSAQGGLVTVYGIVTCS